MCIRDRFTASKPSKANIVDGGKSTSGLKPFVIGGLICIVAGVLDSFALELTNVSGWSGWPVWVTFALFILQTFVLSSYVGKQLNKSQRLVPAWTFFFFWSLVFINLILCLVLFVSNWREAMQLSLVFAFFAAQMGLVVVWGVLGAFDWRKRIPLACLGVFLATYPFWLIDSRRVSRNGWFSVLMCYFAAVFITCCVLKFRRYQLTTLNFGKAALENDEPKGQFSILQLFTWTTVVAVLFGIGRFIPWDMLWESLLTDWIQFAVLAAMLMTVITVATCWAALGRGRSSDDSGKATGTSVVFRVLLLVVLLAACSIGLSLSESVFNNGGWSRSFVGGWNLSPQNMDHQLIIFGIWFAWTALNGLFLFGMLQIFAAAGCRLARKPKNVSSNSQA